MLTLQINEYSTEVVWQIYLSVCVCLPVYLVRPDLDHGFTKLLTVTFDRLSNHWASVIFICEIRIVTLVIQSFLKLLLLIHLKMYHL